MWSWIFFDKKKTFYWIENTVKTVKYYLKCKITVFCLNILSNVIYACDQSWILFDQIHFTGIKYSKNIDNNQKCFLSSKSAYYYDFWRSCDTEDWSNDAENTALITEINYSLTHIHIENSCFTLE